MAPFAGAAAVKRCKLALQTHADAAPEGGLAPSEIAQMVGLAEHEVADLLHPEGSAEAQSSARYAAQMRGALTQLHGWCATGRGGGRQERRGDAATTVPSILHALQDAVRCGSDEAEADMREAVGWLPDFVGAVCGCESAQDRVAAALGGVETVHDAVGRAMRALSATDPGA